MAAVLAVGPAAVSGAQEDPEPSVPAAPDADQAPVPETTTTLAVIAPPSPSPQDVPLTESEKATQLIQYVIIGLVVLAFVVLVASIVFWRRTKPSRIMAAEIARTAAARPSVLTHEGVVGPEAQPASPAAGFSTTPADNADRVGSPAVPGPAVDSAAAASPPVDSPPAVSPAAVSPAEQFVPAAATTPSAPAAVPSVPVGGGGGMWASQGWGENSPSPARPAPEPTPAPASPARAASSPEPVPEAAASDPDVERSNGGESTIPAGFFGRADDLADSESDANGDTESDAPNPFLPRR